MIRRQGKTVLLVSHNIRQVERMCNRVLLLDHRGVTATDMRYSIVADVPFAAVRHYKLTGP